MTTETTADGGAAPMGREWFPPPSEKAVRSIDVWARSAPIRLAGYEDDPAESHILRSID